MYFNMRTGQSIGVYIKNAFIPRLSFIQIGNQSNNKKSNSDCMIIRQYWSTYIFKTVNSHNKMY